jgi:hypothetical protein
MILLSLPVLFVRGWSNFRIGKLSVVYDQAGKARVVAIVNWWIQVALKPLHKHLFAW